MATKAYLEGRDAGYCGAAKSVNPYRKGWARLGFDTFNWADDWDRGFDQGRLLLTGTFADLMRSINDLVRK